MRSKRYLRFAVILVLTVCITAIIISATRWRGASPFRRLDSGHSGWALTVLDDGTLVAAGKTLVTGWNPSGEKQKFEIETEVPVSMLANGQDGRFYVLDEEGGLLCFDDRGQTVAARPAGATAVQCISFRGGRLAAVTDGTLLWLDPLTLRLNDSEPRALPEPASFVDHQHDVVCVGNFLSAKLHVFEGAQAWTVPIARVGAIRISEDAKWIAVVTWRGELVVIDRVQRLVAWRKELAWTGQMKSVSFSPDSDRVATCSPVRGRLWVFDRESGKSILESAVGGDALVVRFLTSDEIVALHADGDLRWWSMK